MLFSIAAFLKWTVLMLRRAREKGASVFPVRIAGEGEFLLCVVSLDCLRRRMFISWGYCSINGMGLGEVRAREGEVLH